MIDPHLTQPPRPRRSKKTTPNGTGIPESEDHGANSPDQKALSRALSLYHNGKITKEQFERFRKNLEEDKDQED